MIILQLKAKAKIIQGIYSLCTGVNVCRMLDIWSIVLLCDFPDLPLIVQIKPAYLNDRNYGKNSIKRLIRRLISEGKAIVSVV